MTILCVQVHLESDLKLPKMGVRSYPHPLYYSKVKVTMAKSLKVLPQVWQKPKVIQGHAKDTIVLFLAMKIRHLGCKTPLK